MHFIKTNDENTKNILEQQGFQFLNKDGDFFVFLNDSKQKLSYELKDKIVFTNNITI